MQQATIRQGDIWSTISWKKLCLMFVCFKFTLKQIWWILKILRFHDFCAEFVGDGVMFVSSHDVIPYGRLGSKHQLTDWLCLVRLTLLVLSPSFLSRQSCLWSVLSLLRQPCFCFVGLVSVSSVGSFQIPRKPQFLYSQLSSQVSFTVLQPVFEDFLPRVQFHCLPLI